jgi:hypothetical protein
MDHVATIKAYERKSELGGGFRAQVVPTVTGEQKGLVNWQSEVLESRDAARYAAQAELHRQMNGAPYRRAHLAARFCGSKYVSNIWA